MTDPIEIAPSVLSADHARLGAQVAFALNGGARRIHVDVMDGHFVPNLTFGPGTVAGLAPLVHASKGVLECHLMVEEPDHHLAGFASAGADVITVHAEACCQLHRTIENVRALGSDVGVALNPGTSPEAVEEILTEVALVLVMTVDPGFGGQALIPSTLDKVRRIARLLASRGLTTTDLEVDGGIHEQTIAMAVDAGATIAVAGSAIFDSDRPISACIATLRAAAARTVTSGVTTARGERTTRDTGPAVDDVDQHRIDTIRSLSTDAPAESGIPAPGGAGSGGLLPVSVVPAVRPGRADLAGQGPAGPDVLRRKEEP